MYIDSPSLWHVYSNFAQKIQSPSCQSQSEQALIDLTWMMWSGQAYYSDFKSKFYCFLDFNFRLDTATFSTLLVSFVVVFWGLDLVKGDLCKIIGDFALSTIYEMLIFWEFLKKDTRIISYFALL